MPQFREHPAAEFLRSFPVAKGAKVSLERVIAQRATFAELSATALLEPSLDVLLAKACAVAARSCNVPMVKVLEHRPGSGEFLIVAGMGLQPGVVGHVRVPADPSNPAGEAFQTGRPVAVRDVGNRPDYHLPPIFPSHSVVASANVPIIGLAGYYGVLEVDATEARDFDILDLSFLASIAEIIADAIERVRRHSDLQAAKEARELLLREHHHRSRNSYQVIIGTLQRHMRQATTEDSRRRFDDVRRRVFALASLYDHLIGDTTAGELDFCRYLGDLCRRMRDFYGTEERGIELLADCPDFGLRFDVDTCTALGTVINELVANAIEHAFPNGGGRIEVRLVREDDEPVLIVRDNGAGFAEAQSESIGLSTAQRLVAAAGGQLTRTDADSGTSWTIRLPPTTEPGATEKTTRAAPVPG
jgi:two-component sensor histidine kinase